MFPGVSPGAIFRSPYGMPGLSRSHLRGRLRCEWTASYTDIERLGDAEPGKGNCRCFAALNMTTRSRCRGDYQADSQQGAGRNGKPAGKYYSKFRDIRRKRREPRLRAL